MQVASRGRFWAPVCTRCGDSSVGTAQLTQRSEKYEVEKFTRCFGSMEGLEVGGGISARLRPNKSRPFPSPPHPRASSIAFPSFFLALRSNATSAFFLPFHTTPPTPPPPPRHLCRPNPSCCAEEIRGKVAAAKFRSLVTRDVSSDAPGKQAIPLEM